MGCEGCSFLAVANATSPHDLTTAQLKEELLVNSISPLVDALSVNQPNLSKQATKQQEQANNYSTEQATLTSSARG